MGDLMREHPRLRRVRCPLCLGIGLSLSGGLARCHCEECYGRGWVWVRR